MTAANKRAGLFSRYGLPLLAKELIEQAARKRTYILRVLYASLLFVAASLMFYETLRIGTASPFAVLGHGREVFLVLVGLQFAGVYLFMPAITCGVLTQEKERDSLMLLFLTRLGPWTIVVEKLMGRLIPMICFLLLSLPLLAFAYTLGGITAETLWGAVAVLFLAALQAGTIALACSAWFRTTVGAFIASYVIGGLLFLGLPMTVRAFIGGGYAGNHPLFQFLLSFGVYDHVDQILTPFYLPIQYFTSAVSSGKVELGKLFLRCVPAMMQCAACLILARVFVVRRAFVPPRNLLLALFRSLDRLFRRMNDNRFTRGIVLIPEKSALPVCDPVAWRETTKRSLGRPQYLLRIFLAIEVPLCFMLLLIAIMGGGESGIEGATTMLFLLWVLSVLIVGVQSASLIAGERSHQTLDVLAVTPLTGEQILRQKCRGVWRVIFVLLIPFATIFLFEAWWRSSVPSAYSWDRRNFGVPLYLVATGLAVGIYLPLVAWLSLLIGLVVRSQARAIIAAVGVIVGWCILPLVFIVLPTFIIFRPMLGPGNENPLLYLTLLSPATIIPMSEFDDLHHYSGGPWAPVVINFLVYGLVLLVTRDLCLRNADRFLGRTESQ